MIFLKGKISVEQTQCSYGGYGTVSIVDVAGHLSKIHTAGDDEFWVKTEKLKYKQVSDEAIYLHNHAETSTEDPGL